MFEVENELELPGTFTFEQRARLGLADRVLNSTKRDRLGKKNTLWRMISLQEAAEHGQAWEIPWGPREQSGWGRYKE